MFFWRRRHPIRDEELSAYLDSQLAPPDRARLERHVESCATCRDTLGELRALRSALRSLPRSRAPRSFALREADVRAATARPGAALGRATPLLSGVTAAALVAFGALVSADVANQGGEGEGRPGTVLGGVATNEPQGEALERRAPQEEPALGDQDQAKEAAPDAGTVLSLSPTATMPKPTPVCPPNAFCPPDASFNDSVLTPPEPTAAVTRPASTAEARARLEDQADAESGMEAERAAEADDSDARIPLRAAEAATAAVALVAATSLAFVWWRRRP